MADITRHAMKPKPDRYSMSFTTGGLFRHESVILASLYLDLHDWNTVRDRIFAENLLQARTRSTKKRLYCEVCARLMKLSDAEMRLLLAADAIDQGYMLWIAVCRRFQFIAEFATEVVRENFLMYKHSISHEDFDSFFDQKAEMHGELESLKRETKLKLRQVLFKTMREADLLEADNAIKSFMPTSKFLEMLEPRESLFFPTAMHMDQGSANVA